MDITPFQNETPLRKQTLSIRFISSLLFSVVFFLMIPTNEALAKRVESDLNDNIFISKWDNTPQRYITILPGEVVVGERYDILIGLHGHGSDRWQFAKDERPECAAFRDFARNHGMIAVSPDYRAKTSWMGPAAEHDLLQIIDKVKSDYQIGNVYLVGASMGGTSALTFAVLHPDLIHGVASMNGHANHLEFDNFQDAIANSFGGTKVEVPEEYKKRSAEYWPEKISMAIAFTVGIQDSIVPPSSVIRLSGILDKLGRKTLLIADRQGGHETSYEDAMSAMAFLLGK